MSVKINGKYSSATVFTTDNPNTALDKYARVQLENLCSNEVSLGSTIRVMPDVHPGKICTIGLTMTLAKTIMPQLLGLDIGCGVTVAKIMGVRKEWQRLDSLIRDFIPSGFERRKSIHRSANSINLQKLNCYRHLQKDAVLLSLGTLGGGNHFIEVDCDSSGSFYLMVHSGSRSLGAELSSWYQNAGHRQL
ncbi:MAG: RtcB family protein, partial [Treponema sp.]|nr:RtcB family protein [Treponema sp.]